MNVSIALRLYAGNMYTNAGGIDGLLQIGATTVLSQKPLGQTIRRAASDDPHDLSHSMSRLASGMHSMHSGVVSEFDPLEEEHQSSVGDNEQRSEDGSLPQHDDTGKRRKRVLYQHRYGGKRKNGLHLSATIASNN